MNFTEILGVDFVNASLPESVEYALYLMRRREAGHIIVLDAVGMYEYDKSRKFRNAVDNAAMVLPGDKSILTAAHILGSPIQRRISETEFCAALFARMSEKNQRLFILGTEPDTVEAARERLERRYPGLKIVGVEDGYYSNDQDIVDYINELDVDLVLVCHGSPKQEYWMNRYGKYLNVGLLLGLGDGLIAYAGMEKQVPKRWRGTGFEWLYRLIHQPEKIFDALKTCRLNIKAAGKRLGG